MRNYNLALGSHIDHKATLVKYSHTIRFYQKYSANN